jgi:hypothetical protein
MKNSDGASTVFFALRCAIDVEKSTNRHSAADVCDLGSRRDLALAYCA